MKTRLILLILLPFLLSCQHMPPGTPKTRQEQEDDIREAVFRYLLENAPRQQNQNGKMYFLSFQSKEPDSIFIRRFGKQIPQVKMGSQCTTPVSLDTATWAVDFPPFVDKKTGQKGIKLVVGDPNWINDDIVAVDGSYQESILNLSNHIFFLEMKNRRWLVKRVKETSLHGFEPVYQQQPEKTPEKWRAQEDDIREVAFRYLFKIPGELQGKCAGAFYLAYRESPGKRKDPDERFMQRLASNVPMVKKASQCTLAIGTFICCNGDTYREYGVVDKQTGKTGIELSVDEINWLRSDVVIIEGRSYEYDLGSSGWLFYLIKEGNSWVMKEERLLWVS